MSATTVEAAASAVETAATTVESTHASAVETAAHAPAMESAYASTMEAAAATSVEAVSTAEGSSATETAIRMSDWRSAEAYPGAAVTIAATVAITAAIPAAMPIPSAPPPMTPVAAVPWASADKHAADEPARAVVAIRRAGVRIVTVITIWADRSRTVGIARVVSLIVIPAISIARIILGLSGLHERQRRHQKPQCKYPSENFLHNASPIRPHRCC